MFDDLPENFHASIDAHKYWDKANHGPIARLFFHKLSNFLMETYSVPKVYADGAAAELSDSMRASNLSYHNPLHILSILDWAELNKINLTPVEQLTLWFHDAIYDPQAVKLANEAKSACLARIILTRIGISPKEVNRVSKGILATARHCELDVDLEFERILDVDVCAFAWPRADFLAQDKAVSMEYIPTIGEEKWKEGRKKFVQQFLSKGFVYRSFDFREFEQAAVKNLTT